jgi:hypothetical protein
MIESEDTGARHGNTIKTSIQKRSSPTGYEEKLIGRHFRNKMLKTSIVLWNNPDKSRTVGQQRGKPRDVDIF